MAEDRPLLEPEEAIAALRAELEDKISTLNARSGRLPTGSMLPTLATTAPAGTLLLLGQTVQRDQFPDLYAWVVATSAGGFTVTPTTLQLPDARDRVLVGVAAGQTVGQVVGANTRALTIANLPAHDHNVSGSGTASSAGTHSHSGSTGTAGSHGGHTSGTTNVTQAGSGVTLPASYSDSNGSHSHSLDLNDSGSHTHNVSLSISEQSVGSGTPVDLRQAGLAVNVLIWC